MKHTAGLTQLQANITSCGFTVSRTRAINFGHQIIISGGAILNWYPDSGTLVFQGTEPQRSELESAYEEVHGGTP